MNGGRMVEIEDTYDVFTRPQTDSAKLFVRGRRRA